MSNVILTDYRLEGDKQIATHSQDCRGILDFNESQRRNSDENWNQADHDIKPVARIPRVIWLLWQQMGIDDDSVELMKQLERHPEYKRTEKQIGEKPKQYYDLKAPVPAGIL